MRRSFRRPSAAMVVACIALLVALGGTSYATVLQVPRNSVGTPQLQRNAVKASKIAPDAVRTGHVLDGSLLVADFKAGQIPQGPKGDKGDKGGTGATGVSAYEVVQSNLTFTNQFVGSRNVSCPSGKKAVGGGAFTSPQSSTGPWLVGSLPTAGGAGWIAHWSHPTQSTWTSIVYAICVVVTS